MFFLYIYYRELWPIYLFIYFFNNLISVFTLYYRREHSKAVEILRKDLKLFESFNESLYKEITHLLTLRNFRYKQIYIGLVLYFFLFLFLHGIVRISIWAEFYLEYSNKFSHCLLNVFVLLLYALFCFV